MLQLTVVIDAPQARTFDVFTDLQNAPDRLSGVTKLEVLGEGPVGAGTRFRETRVMFGKEHEEMLEITDYEPDTSYTVGCTSYGCEYTTVFRFVPEGESTRVDMDMRSRPLTFSAKVFGPIMGLMTKRAMRKVMQKDLEELKQVAEAGATV